MADSSRLAAGRRPALTRRAALAGALQALALLAACTNLPAPVLIEPARPAGSGATPPPPGAQPPPEAAGAPSRPAIATPGDLTAVGPDATCVARLPAAVAPTPLPYPGSTQKEPETGLHVTGPAHMVNLAAYRLEVTGKVQHPLSLTFEELRCLPRTEAQLVLECPGLFFDPQKLAGTSLANLVLLARPRAGAETMHFSAVDGYERDFPLAEAWALENFLAYEVNGQLLPASHGFPLRAVLPARVGSAWMKWLLRIELI